MIRQASINDLNEIAKIHAICFPESYITQFSYNKWFGKRLIPAFYKIYMQDNPELFIVASDDEKGIVGFCMGYYMDNNDQISRFITQNRISIILNSLVLLIKGNKPTWNKLLGRLKHKPSINDWTIVNDKYDIYSDKLRGDLLSVCVLPNFRGKKYAQEMMETYLKILKNNGCKLCLLSVKQDNVRAIQYYKRNGFELYRTRGNEGYTFIKVIE